jgi:hypothetical protein
MTGSKTAKSIQLALIIRPSSGISLEVRERPFILRFGFNL